MKPKIVVANWKCNPENTVEAVKLLKLSDRKDIIIAPPFVFIHLAGSLANASLGAQNVFWESGAYTGEISANQLSKSGVKYVIVGHSERRSNFGETDEIISLKAKAALDAGLSVIICVGESAIDREGGKVAAERAIRRSVIGSLSGIAPKRSHKIIIAYEPVWAIGTGNADNPDETNERAKLIKSIAEGMGLFGVAVLYGGSVSKDNAAGFLSRPEIDGLLVGGASVDIDEFPKIISILNRFNGTSEAASAKLKSSNLSSGSTRRRPAPSKLGKIEKPSASSKAGLRGKKSRPADKNARATPSRSKSQIKGVGAARGKNRQPLKKTAKKSIISLSRHSRITERNKLREAPGHRLNKHSKRSK